MRSALYNSNERVQACYVPNTACPRGFRQTTLVVCDIPLFLVDFQGFLHGRLFKNRVSFFLMVTKPVFFFRVVCFDFEILVLDAQRADLDVQTYL